MSCRKMEIRGLSVSLADGSRNLIDNMDLTLEAGSSLAVVGESGAGKSMTTLALMGLLPNGIRKTAGKIVINDKQLDALTHRQRQILRNRTLGVIMQNPMSAFDPVFTVFGHFAETARAHDGDGSGDIRTRAASALGEVGLTEPTEILDAYPFQLSGGMLQRVMIALALINNPDYIIADEPTTDLDLTAQKKVLDLIKDRCHARHLGLLLITHDLSVAAYMADRIAIMHRGVIVECGPAGKVMRKPEHPYTTVLLEAHRHLYGSRFSAIVGAGHTMEGTTP